MNTANLLTSGYRDQVELTRELQSSIDALSCQSSSGHASNLTGEYQRQQERRHLVTSRTLSYQRSWRFPEVVPEMSHVTDGSSSPYHRETSCNGYYTLLIDVIKSSYWLSIPVK
ncbi:hypothetical protein RRG08_054507 [Elysia crispata]|uniref:Uncharacterized protein n=1 Tax=Elysia crispata TaxID=231223 RepID=A0AAE1D593_9GAST|nr:hypothetical protein RRG08_054507 [Elysia crispata]